MLRTLDDAARCGPRSTGGARIVVVGAGWIGAEVATAAAQPGCAVTVVEAADAPLAGALGPRPARSTARWYAEAGVDAAHRRQVAAGARRRGRAGRRRRGSTRTRSSSASASGPERPGWPARARSWSAAWSRGRRRPAHRAPDVVRGRRLRLLPSRRYGRRLLVQHWDNALQGPRRSPPRPSLGEDAVYDPVPYFWSEQFGRFVQYAGLHAGADALVVRRGDPAGPHWALRGSTGDRLDALLTVDRPRDLAQARRLIAAGTPGGPGRARRPRRAGPAGRSRIVIAGPDDTAAQGVRRFRRSGSKGA